MLTLARVQVPGVPTMTLGPAAGQNGGMQTDNLIVKDEGQVTRITLNRPEKRNALSYDLMSELVAALRAVENRVVVVEGSGPCFSAGHDLSEMTGQTLAFYQELFT